VTTNNIQGLALCEKLCHWFCRASKCSELQLHTGLKKYIIVDIDIHSSACQNKRIL